MTPLSYHLSNLSLIALETVRLLLKIMSIVWYSAEKADSLMKMIQILRLVMKLCPVIMAGYLILNLKKKISVNNCRMLLLWRIISHHQQLTLTLSTNYLFQVVLANSSLKELLKAPIFTVSRKQVPA